MSADSKYVTVRLTRTQAEVCVISLETDLESLDRDDAADLFGSRNAADAGWRALETLHLALGHDMVTGQQPEGVTE